MALKDFFVIGDYFLEEWSEGFDKDAYLKVLPHPDIKVDYHSAWLDWQEGQKNYKDGIYTDVGPNGNYYSSWGPDNTLEVTLTLSEADEIFIDGLGKIVAGSTDNHSVYDDGFQLYNGSTQGPLLVADPGDTLKIKLINDLEVNETYQYFGSTNLHTHGLHVSPLGPGDNVLISIDPGETWETEIKIPDNHFVGPDWYHPHLHGATNVQISKGLVGMLLLQPSVEETSQLDFFSPVDDPVHWFGIQSWGLNQQERPASADDPLNQDAGGGRYRVGTPIESYTDQFGVDVYTISEAEYIGYNYYPGELQYNPLYPSTSAEGYADANAAVQATGGFIPTYGAGTNGGAIENVIHTVNGQYNPTVPAKVGEWNLFGFLNLTVNTHQVIQLVREFEGELNLEEFQVVAVDGDVAGAASQVLDFVTETPVMAPGGRMTIQHNFTEPGDYYFLTNASDEILGDDAPQVANTSKAPLPSGNTYNGINDGHLIWGAQVLASVEVTGDAIDQKPDAPQPWDYIVNESIKIEEWIDDSKQKLAEGNLKQRQYIWEADFSNLAGAIDDSDPSSFEGVYTINGRYFGHTPQEQTVLSMPMLGTTEEWTILNTSIGVGYPYFWGEWHPFHIHQNDFVVTHLNGLPVEEITSYPANQLADTVVLGGQYINGTETAENPYGQAASLVFDPTINDLAPIEGATPFEARIMMKFEDYPGAYVNHCHILFHEDAGMMQAVKVILNTDSTFLATDQAEESVTLRLGSSTDQPFQLQPYENGANENIIVAVGDVNYGKFFSSEGLQNNVNYRSGTKGSSDNITDVVTIHESKEANNEFKIRVFDGDALKQASTGLYKFTGFAPIDSDNMSSEVISESGNLKQLTLNGDIYLEKASTDPDDHRGTGGTGAWNLSNMEGTTYINDVFNSDGSYAGWNASTNPSEITGTNGETIPSSYSDGSFVFSSADGLDSLVASEVHDVNEVSDGIGFEHYNIQSGTGRFEDASSGQIFGFENFYGGADITLYSDPQSPIQAKPQEIIDGRDTTYILKDITPFTGINHDSKSKTSLAVGDIDGDGFADIIAGIGSNSLQPTIEIYSGADYSLMGRINPFGDEATSINLAAGDINSDNFVDIIVGQGEGGTGRVEAFSGRLIFDVIQNRAGANNGDASVQGVNPLDGNALSKATELFSDVFRPFADEEYTGAVDVSSGYILPRPEDLQTNDRLDQVVQTSFANLIALKVNSDSSKKLPSIKTFYYTGGSGHASHTDHGDHAEQTMFPNRKAAKKAAKNFGCQGAHQMGDSWMPCKEHGAMMTEMTATSNQDPDIPTLESALNINKKISSINGSFLDLSSDIDDRGYGALITQLNDGRQYAYYIETDEMQSGNQQVFKHRKISLTAGEKLEGTPENDKMIGTSGNDSITGHKGADTLRGRQGDDILNGNNGNDRLKGGLDNDILNGGKGNNTLHGGNGRDTFIIGQGQDLIKDFNIKKDMIEVPNSNYSIVDDGENSQITFTVPGSNHEIIATIVGVDASTLEDNSSNIIAIDVA